VPSRIRALTRNDKTWFSLTPRFSEVIVTLDIGTQPFQRLAENR